MRRRRWLGVGWLAVTAAVAADDPAALVRYRQHAMKAAGADLQATCELVEGGVTLGKEHLLAHARALADFARLLPELFPPGSTSPDSDAEPAVWRDRGGFERAADRLRTATGRLLAEAAEGGRDRAGLQEHYEAVQQACRGCHKGYRAR